MSQLNLKMVILVTALSIFIFISPPKTYSQNHSENPLVKMRGDTY